MLELEPGLEPDLTSCNAAISACEKGSQWQHVTRRSLGFGGEFVWANRVRPLLAHLMFHFQCFSCCMGRSSDVELRLCNYLWKFMRG